MTFRHHTLLRLLLFLPAGVYLVVTAGYLAAQDAPRAVPVQEVPAAVMPDFSVGDRVISQSEQFRIKGGEGITRGSIAMLAEEAKSDLLGVTEEKDDWRQAVGSVPITITLHGQQGDPLPARTSAMKLVSSEAGYELLLDYHLSRGIEQESFKRFITVALVYERSLRGKVDKEDETALNVQPWLVDGLREAVAWKLGNGDRRLYEGLFKRGGLFKLDQLFAIDENARDEMDAATRAAYRVSAGALVMALLEQPQGKNGFRAFLNEVAAFDGEMPALLRKHFPEMNLSGNSLAKWWALQLASKGAAPVSDVMSIPETERLLGEALRLTLRSPEGINEQKDLASSWQMLMPMKVPERVEAVRLAQDALIRLSYRCFPSYRPMLLEYQLILNSLVQGKADRLASRLAYLEESRVTLVAKANRARDYMDWFEITRARETSGVFDDYLTLKERLRVRTRPRNDELSKYLDRLDAIFNRGQTAPGKTSITNGASIPQLPK